MPRSNKTSSHQMKRTATHLAKVASIHNGIPQQAQQDLLRVITCGSANDGKSTLVGRLIWESQQVDDNQPTALLANSRQHDPQGQNIDFALLADGPSAERKQDTTINSAYHFFAMPRGKFIVAPYSGDEQYTRNVLTALPTADVAVLLIDARHGVLTQTRQHAYLLSLAGVRQVVLAVNKIDLMGYEQGVFDAIVADFNTWAKPLPLKSITPIPMSALKGDNITERSAQTPWYQGPTLMRCLETSLDQRPILSKPIFLVRGNNRLNASLCAFSGTLTSGQLAVGDTLRVTASGQTATLARIFTANGDLEAAHTDDAVTLVLDREINVSRSDVITLAEQPLEMTEQFEATLVWVHDEPGFVGRAYELKLANQRTNTSITGLKYRINVNTQAHESCNQLTLNDIAVANLALNKPLAFAPYDDNHTLGAFILADKLTHMTVAAGLIRHNLRRAQNVHRQALSITREDRERINGHKGKVIWFTGLSGAGKSTVANALEKELHAQGKRTYILDGDNIRQGLNKDLGFTDADRVENIRRVAEVAKLMMDAGLIVMTAFISPFRAERQMARDLIGDDSFIEVFVDTPLAVCEKRDPKGLYKKARNGELPNMTGINSPYERPEKPDLVLQQGSLGTQDIIRLLA